MRHSIYLIGFLITTFAAFSQKRQTVTVKKYTTKNGLSSYNIRKIIQDKWGFVWVGTQDGLSRFDGRSFINYTKNSSIKKRISGTDVRELIEDSTRNLLWVLPSDVGINAINTITGEVVISEHIPYLSNDDWNISMLKSEDELWIGTSTGVKIYNAAKKKFLASPLLPKKPITLIDFAVRSIAKDEYGNIWAFYDRYGIVVYQAKTKEIIKEIRITELNDHRKSNEIRVLSYILLKNVLLLATNQGLRKISYSNQYDFTLNNHPCSNLKALNTENINCITLDKQNNIIISGYNKLYKFNYLLSNYEILEEPGRIGATDWLNAVQCIYHDADNNIWLGCQEGLAFVSKNHNPFRHFNYDKTSNTILDHVRSICPLSNGDILVGLINGIVDINQNSNKYIKSDTGHLYHHIYQDKKGYIHVSRSDGMFIFDKGRLISISKIYPEFLHYSSISINSHLFINDSLIILGSENNNGILIWDPSKKTVKKYQQGSNTNSLSSSIVNNLYKDSNQHIWVLSDNVITVFTKDMIKLKDLVLFDKSSNSSYKLFFDMCEANGYYWIASYGSGIIQLDSNYNIISVVSTDLGLWNDGVYQIYNILDKNLLITSNNGLSVFDLNNFKFKNYFEEDGLHSSGFEEVCGMSKDGFIYAGGVNGFTIIDPSKIETNTILPTFHYNNIKIETKVKTIDTTNLTIHTLNVPNNWLQVTISFIGLNYINPNRVTYQYRIKEKDTSWVNNGTQNFISLIGLTPGSFTFEVRAANEDGYLSPPKQLILIFEPKWYQTLSFKIFIIAAIAGLLYSLYRYRITQIKKQQQIRKDIASDLHDDIGSSLNTVKIFAHLAKREQGKESHLEQIESSLTQATAGLRDLIWVLDDSQDTAFELVERIKKFALPVLQANDIQLETQVESDDHKFLSKTEKRNLLLIAKESINNSIKYSACKIIKVRIKQVADKITFSVQDDGQGFNTSNQSEGNGLKNIRERARQIHYSVEIISNPEEGTFIRLIKK